MTLVELLYAECVSDNRKPLWHKLPKGVDVRDIEAQLLLLGGFHPLDGTASTHTEVHFKSTGGQRYILMPQQCNGYVLNKSALKDFLKLKGVI